MSEESKVIYCTSCGGENPADFKFCSHCGNKLEIPETESSMQPVYEKVEAEILEGSATIPVQESEEKELDIHYATEDETTTESVYESANSQYYTSSAQAVNVSQENGNIGFAIGSMVCGIFALLCCCTGFISLILSVVAIVLGVVVVKNNYAGKGMAIAGLITGGLGLLLVIGWLILGGFTDLLSEMTEEIINY